jgi:predicted NBD/HSP70 family sugar kinase
VEKAEAGDIRRNNLVVVLRELATGGPDSRAGLAARTGLTRATVSRLVVELMLLGLVREGDRENGGRAGRPGTLVHLDGRHVIAVGTEVNVDYLSFLAVDLAGREVYREEREYPAMSASTEETLEALVQVCRDGLRQVRRHSGVAAAGLAGLSVAVPGLADVAAGVIARAPNLHWRDVAVAEHLRRRLRLGAVPVSVGNDANLAAVAEYRVGEFAGTPNLIYVTGEVGIGGGIVVGGQPLLGTRGYGGEIGHMCIDRDGPVCGCGRRGCWEASIGLAALLRSAGLPDGDAGSPRRAVGPLVARAAAGDARVLAALERLGVAVGVGVANLVNLFDPQVIVLGGYFVEVGAWMLPAARRTFVEQAFAPSAGSTVLAVSALEYTAAARGGAIRAQDRILADPTRLGPALGRPG